MAERTRDSGDRYQRETKYSRESIGRDYLDRDRMPEPFKEYPDARRVIKLSPPQHEGGMGLWQALFERRSQRGFNNSPLTLNELSQLLFATQGVTAQTGGYLLRAAPSAGALYPIESYLIVNRVETLSPGLYHFNVLRNSMELLGKEHAASALCRAALGQIMIIEGAAVFIWTAVIARSKWKYGERAYRYIYMDAGHIGENLYLAAVALNLGCCTIGAFFDDEVNEIIGVDGVKETAVYMGVVGRCD